MIYNIKITEEAKKEILWYKINDKKSLVKIKKLIDEIQVNPRNGIGKPERLKYFENEVYSRRVNLKNRIVYSIYEDLKEIEIIACRGHYEF